MFWLSYECFSILCNAFLLKSPSISSHNIQLCNINDILKKNTETSKAMPKFIEKIDKISFIISCEIYILLASYIFLSFFLYSVLIPRVESRHLCYMSPRLFQAWSGQVNASHARATKA